MIVNLFAFAAVVVFVKFRHNDSQFTKDVVTQLDFKITNFVDNPQLPPAIGLFYNFTLKGLIYKFIAPIRVPAIKASKKTE